MKQFCYLLETHSNYDICSLISTTQWKATYFLGDYRNTAHLPVQIGFRLSIGCSQIDQVINQSIDGLCSKRLYCVFGPAGSGKSTFLLQMLVNSFQSVRNGGGSVMPIVDDNNNLSSYQQTVFHLDCTPNSKSRALFTRLSAFCSTLNVDERVCLANLRIYEIENTSRMVEALLLVNHFAVTSSRVPVVTVDGLYQLFKRDHPYAYPDIENNERNLNDFKQLCSCWLS